MKSAGGYTEKSMAPKPSKSTPTPRGGKLTPTPGNKGKK